MRLTKSSYSEKCINFYLLKFKLTTSWASSNRTAPMNLKICITSLLGPNMKFVPEIFCRKISTVTYLCTGIDIPNTTFAYDFLRVIMIRCQICRRDSCYSNSPFSGTKIFCPKKSTRISCLGLSFGISEYPCSPPPFYLDPCKKNYNTESRQGIKET